MLWSKVTKTEIYSTTFDIYCSYHNPSLDTIGIPKFRKHIQIINVITDVSLVRSGVSIGVYQILASYWRGVNQV